MPTTTIDEIIKIQSKGVMTIPKNARDKYGFADNSFLRLKEEKNRLYLERVRVLPYPVRSYTQNDLDEFFAFDKQLS